MNWEIKTANFTNLLSDKLAPTLNTSMEKSVLLRKNVSIFQQIKTHLNRQAWFIRLTNKEYWNSQVFFIPLAVYVVYLAYKAKSPIFFSAANPSIPTGGAVGENKADISRWIPPQYRPKNTVISAKTSLLEIRQALMKAKLTFPLILKPTVGARGLLVKKVESISEIMMHLNRFPTDFLVEEFIDYPIESAVLYWKNPETGASGIQSVTVKEFLSVVGDGQSSVKSLLGMNPRGILQIPRLSLEKAELMQYVPKNGEKIVVEPIGNHVRGTKFLNYNHLITPEMVAAFDKIQANLPDCYCFRLDLKTPSVSDLQNGYNIKILEINGVGSDPAHIFDPSVSLWEMYAAYFRLWKKIYDISTTQHRRGVAYMTLKEYRHFAKQQKLVTELMNAPDF